MKTMLKRTVTGLILLAVLALMLFIGSFEPYGFIALDLLIFIAVAIASIEMYRVMRTKYQTFLTPIIVVIIITYPLQFVFEEFVGIRGGGFSGIMVSAIVGFLITVFMFIFDPKDRSFEDFISTIFVLLYPLLITSMAYVSNHRLGFLPILLAMGTSLTADAFAYFIGSIFKGPKIFPRISPKKTYSGCIGGLVGGVVGAIIVYLIFEVAKFPTHVTFTITNLVESSGWASGWTWGIYCLLGFTLGIISEIGDLMASAIKRRFAVKDYSNLLGTHGGVMDRIDSIIFALILLIPLMVTLAY